ncbi:MAG: hypothetical protein J5922_05275 [Clostridia bacterium]|nr:hypothetical protein [Clostridia bacterium]
MAKGKAFSSPSDMEKKINRYFESISRRVPRCDKDGELIKNQNGDDFYSLEWIEPPTLSGLCLYLNISKETFLRYGRNEEYSKTVKWAMGVMENYLENALFRDKQVQGVMFSLKSNYGWDEKENQLLSKPGKDFSPCEKMDLLKELVSEFTKDSEKTGILRERKE